MLGRHWKSATNEQRAEFSAIFLDFIARVYASRFDSYSYGGEQFTVRSVIADESGDKIVRSQVARPSGADPVELDFRVRSKDGNHKVVDLYVEGYQHAAALTGPSSARSSIAKASTAC